MDFLIDDRDARGAFFITIPLNPKESICFDKRGREPKVIKQVLVASRPLPKRAAESWDRLRISQGRLMHVERIKWASPEGKDQYNEWVWETVWEGKLDKDLAESIKKHSDLIRKNRKELAKHEKEIRAFEMLLNKALAKQLVALLQHFKKSK